MPRLLDRSEFGHLFTEHARLLWVIAAAFVRRDQIEDVLQEAAATALDRLRDFDATTSFAAWLAQIVRYTAANAGRRLRRHGAAAPLETEPARDAGLAPPPIAMDGHVLEGQTEFDDEVLHALDELLPEMRAAFLLRVVAERSYAEIADLLGVPEGTVASHVHRARAALRARLAPMPSTKATAAHTNGLTNQGVKR